MEIGNQQNFSTNPLTSISSRQVNTSTVSSGRSSTGETTEAEQKQRIEQSINEQDARLLQRLRSRDREVRAHEAAHAAAGGPVVQGGPSYTFQKGPDGRSYAIGGEVRIDTSKVANDPEATLAKADRVRRAALAPAQPSPQDIRVASRANQTAAQARVEIAALRAEQATQKLEEQSEALGEAADSDVSPENVTESDNEVNSDSSGTPDSVAPTSNLSAIQSLESEESRFISVSLFA
jgi:SprA-related family